MKPMQKWREKIDTALAYKTVGNPMKPGGAILFKHSDVRSLRMLLNNNKLPYNEREQLLFDLELALADCKSPFVLTTEHNERGLQWFKDNAHRWRTAFNRGKAKKIMPIDFIVNVERTLDGDFEEFRFGGLHRIEGRYDRQYGRFNVMPWWQVIPLKGNPWKYAYGSWQSGSRALFDYVL